MNTFDTHRKIRAFGLFMFGGVPEIPEQWYEPKPNPYTEPRYTRQIVLSETQNDYNEGEIIEEFEIKFPKIILNKGLGTTGDEV